MSYSALLYDCMTINKLPAPKQAREGKGDKGRERETLLLTVFSIERK